MSKEKLVSHRNGPSIPVLGLDYITGINVFQIIAPLSKRSMVESAINDTILMIEEKKLQPEIVERTIGLIIFVYYFQPFGVSSAPIRMLSMWKNPIFFRQNIKRNAPRHILFMLLQQMKSIIQSIEPLVIRRNDDSGQNRVQVYTDASGDENNDITDMAVGGIIFADHKVYGFSEVLKFDEDLIKTIPKFHIGVSEMLACALSSKIAPKLFTQKMLIRNIDNLGDVYSLAKQCSTCLLTQCILELVCDFEKQHQTSSYWRYIHTSRNLGDPFTRKSELHRIMREYPGIEMIPVTHQQWTEINSDLRTKLAHIRQIGHLFYEHVKSKKALNKSTPKDHFTIDEVRKVEQMVQYSKKTRQINKRKIAGQARANAPKVTSKSNNK